MNTEETAPAVPAVVDGPASSGAEPVAARSARGQVSGPIAVAAIFIAVAIIAWLGYKYWTATPTRTAMHDPFRNIPAGMRPKSQAGGRAGRGR